MLEKAYRSIFGHSKQPQPSHPVPPAVTKVRKYSSHKHQILRWEDGTIYDGQCSNGTIFDGVGKLCLANGELYQGSFCESQFHGQGKYTYTDGSYYQGTWKNDIRNGIGKQVNADGTQYIGNFKNGVKDGFGVLSWRDGSYYQGNFVNDAMEGLGKLKSADASVYLGQWVQGKEEGVGQLVNNKIVYKGGFRKGLKHGQGIQIDKETDVRIEGNWENGKLVGRILIFQGSNIRSAKMIQDNPSYLNDAEYQEQINSDQQIKK